MLYTAKESTIVVFYGVFRWLMFFSFVCAFPLYFFSLFFAHCYVDFILKQKSTVVIVGMSWVFCYIRKAIKIIDVKLKHWTLNITNWFVSATKKYHIPIGNGIQQHNASLSGFFFFQKNREKIRLFYLLNPGGCYLNKKTKRITCNINPTTRPCIESIYFFKPQIIQPKITCAWYQT